jgi:hypothetical protein
MRGHIIPQKRIPPNSRDTFIMYGQIMTTPTYVGAKSKKNLKDNKSSSTWEVKTSVLTIRQMDAEQVSDE